MLRIDERDATTQVIQRAVLARHWHTRNVAPDCIAHLLAFHQIEHLLRNCRVNNFAPIQLLENLHHFMGRRRAQPETFIVRLFTVCALTASTHTSHDSRLFETEGTHARVHGISVEIIQNHIRRRIVAKDHHQANTVLQSEPQSVAKFRQNS